MAVVQVSVWMCVCGVSLRGHVGGEVYLICAVTTEAKTTGVLCGELNVLEDDEK
jgi:hypothetical protein